jgi:hypothetical protein
MYTFIFEMQIPQWISSRFGRRHECFTPFTTKDSQTAEIKPWTD